uniref:Uncharacterized protein n=1 Tax=Oryza punctata TaxID=4537 RepID=A0A0E0K4D7_ORYPU
MRASCLNARKIEGKGEKGRLGVIAVGNTTRGSAGSTRRVERCFHSLRVVLAPVLPNEPNSHHRSELPSSPATTTAAIPGGDRT